ncbi:MAG TPA: DUF5681 domain-containing protein [Rhizomicrobium sp.]|nr:DUF5681 domain-containing protein [Rhizomicrobium sp.]
MSKGRKPRSKDFSSLLDRGLREKVGFKLGGRVKKMARLDLMVLQRVIGATQGDVASLKFLLKHLKEEPPWDPHGINVEFQFPNGSSIAHYYDGRTRCRDQAGNVTWVTTKDEEGEWLRKNSP